MTRRELLARGLLSELGEREEFSDWKGSSIVISLEELSESLQKHPQLKLPAGFTCPPLVASIKAIVSNLPIDNSTRKRSAFELGCTRVRGDIGVGYSASYAMSLFGPVYYWGSDSLGGLVAPERIETLTYGMSSLGNKCVVLSTGNAKCWGDNNYGRAGNNTFSAVYGPTTVLSPRQ